MAAHNKCVRHLESSAGLLYSDRNYSSLAQFSHYLKTPSDTQYFSCACQIMLTTAPTTISSFIKEIMILNDDFRVRYHSPFSIRCSVHCQNSGLATKHNPGLLAYWMKIRRQQCGGCEEMRIPVRLHSN